jgi:hypothetical protein
MKRLRIVDRFVLEQSNDGIAWSEVASSSNRAKLDALRLAIEQVLDAEAEAPTLDCHEPNQTVDLVTLHELETVTVDPID